MYIYRIILDAYDSRNAQPSARVVTYSSGFNRADALRRIGPVRIACNGAVSDGLTPWPGILNLPNGPIFPRALPEWEVVRMRAVPEAGKARIITDGAE